MPVIREQVQQGKPGDGILFASQSEDGRSAAVFKDDGEAAHLYACETVNGPILDALHIYDVDAVKDRDPSSEYKIR